MQKWERARGGGTGFLNPAGIEPRCRIAASLTKDECDACCCCCCYLLLYYSRACTMPEKCRRSYLAMRKYYEMSQRCTDDERDAKVKKDCRE